MFGDRGEAEVARILREACGDDERIVDDLLLDGIDMTTQIDHILIDRYGLLVIETKRYGALLKGRSEERQWTACYRDGNHRPLQNPLRQNDKHREKLATILKREGYQFDASYVQSLVVFAKGTIDPLELTDEDDARVLTLDQLEEHLRTRSDFAPNTGDMTADTVASLALLLGSLDCKDNPDVVARHAASVAAAKRPKSGSNSAVGAPVPRGDADHTRTLRWPADACHAAATTDHGLAARGLVGGARRHRRPQCPELLRQRSGLAD